MARAAACWLGKQWQSVCRLTAPRGRLARRVVDQRRQRIAGQTLRFFRHGVFIPVQMLFHISRLLATACPKQAFAIRQKNVSDYRLFFQNLKFYQKIS